MRKDKLDDKRIIEHLEKTMTDEEKKSPSFIAYKALIKPEEERTDQEKINCEISEAAFGLAQILAKDSRRKKSNPTKIDFRSVVDPILNETFDSRYSIIHLKKGKVIR